MSKEEIAIKKLRGEFLFAGFDSSDMTDKEIKQGITNAAKSIGSFGLTADEAKRAIATFRINK